MNQETELEKFERLQKELEAKKANDAFLEAHTAAMLTQKAIIAANSHHDPIKARRKELVLRVKLTAPNEHGRCCRCTEDEVLSSGGYDPVTLKKNSGPF